MYYAYYETATGRMLGLGTTRRTDAGSLPRGVVELTFDQAVSPLENANWNGSGFTAWVRSADRTVADIAFAEPEMGGLDAAARDKVRTVLDRISTSGSVR